jgi:hypothetical protein
MQSWHGQPIITAEDHPEVIRDALKESHRDEDFPKADVIGWYHTATNAQETLEGTFQLRHPNYRQLTGNERTIIYVWPNDLELALVAYGLKHEADQRVLGEVDELLLSLDAVKAGLVNDPNFKSHAER